MKKWQGIPTTCVTLGGEAMVPRDNRTLVFSTEKKPAKVTGDSLLIHDIYILIIHWSLFVYL